MAPHPRVLHSTVDCQHAESLAEFGVVERAAQGPAENGGAA